MRALPLVVSIALVAGAACDDFAGFAGRTSSDLSVRGPLQDLSSDVPDAHTSADASLPPDLSLGTFRIEPSDTSDDLHAIWGSGPDDIYAVGENGTVTHRRGGSWKRESASVNETLHAVWGSGPTDVWMAGDGGRVVHYDGNYRAAATGDKTALYGGSIYGVGGSVSSNVMVGEGGAVYLYQGGAWGRSLFRTGLALYAVSSQSDTTRYAVGATGIIAQLYGNGGVLEVSGVVADLRGVWGDGKGTVVAVGAGGTTLRRTNASWVSADNADRRDLTAVTGCGGALWAVGADGAVIRSLDGGKRWEVIPTSTGFRLAAVWCSGPEDAYAVATRGLIVHYTR